MSNVMLIVNTGRIVFPIIIMTMLLQAVVASIASLIFPAGTIGARLTKKYFPKLGNLGRLLVSSILPAVFFYSDYVYNWVAENEGIQPRVLENLFYLVTYACVVWICRKHYFEYNH
ncbi:hypothetical protein LQU94_00235 [Peptoniphilus sp. KCTC 25270]|uniref:hypothetical protein n=1 Tax=Peptoniphilus sp. KCTC 25270 TaxID=2897414 RepID=UPI001E52349F|nr:hypothetical protein [Peptoniphilus sp. KCTC 25270]MCD1146542.1 hypothetical protein [Peptoniphilus sp. KCTC 25270]